MSAEIENREAVRSLTLDSQSQSFSSPSSSLSFDETEEEKGVDAVSLSTASMSTNPTPDNPLYASMGGQASKQVKEYKHYGFLRDPIERYLSSFVFFQVWSGRVRGIKKPINIPEFHKIS